MYKQRVAVAVMTNGSSGDSIRRLGVRIRRLPSFERMWRVRTVDSNDSARTEATQTTGSARKPIHIMHQARAADYLRRKQCHAPHVEQQLRRGWRTEPHDARIAGVGVEGDCTTGVTGDCYTSRRRAGQQRRCHKRPVEVLCRCRMRLA
jgi:hypothetical protein